VIAVTEKSAVLVIFVTSKDGALHYVYATNKEGSRPIGWSQGSFGIKAMSGVSIAISGYSASRSSADGCRSAGGFGVVGLAAERVRATLLAWSDRCERRHAALTINARTLADIGLTPGHVTFETAKPFWRA